MFKNNKNLFVIAVIAIVNALGYGIIIPILYSYSQRFGLNDFQNGMLFATFSVCQFIATPIIGRWSDRYGRKPLLIASLIGTALSFVLMAIAPNAIFLFIARALDGLTAGNISVASAVISDTTAPKDRAKGFGIIGASFGFGFVFGPAISAFTVGFGAGVPFIIAAVITVIAVVLTAVLLPETNTHKHRDHKGRLFDIGGLIKFAVDPKVGKILIVSLLYSFALALFIFAYQPTSVKVLHLNEQQISINYTLFGLVGLITQMLLIPRVTKLLGERKAFATALVVACFGFLGMYISKSMWPFVVISLIYGIANSFVNPLLQALLSRAADEKSQGSIMGVNASYVSLGMIFGPIIGGVLALRDLALPFLLGLIVCIGCFVLSRGIVIHGKAHVE